MGVVLAALVPVFLLIVLGFALKQSLMRLETQWHGLERLVYYVLLPALLIDTLTRADLATVPVVGVGGALMLSALLLSLLCLALRPLLAAGCAIDGPALERLCAGPSDGRRRAPAGANHHPANDLRRTDDADRHRVGGGLMTAVSSMRRATWSAASRPDY
jgi:hypothetical protein